MIRGQEYPNVVGYLRTALVDNEMRARARRNMQTALAGGLLGEQTRSLEKGIRVSDAGSCSLELWYKIREKFDLPIDPIDMQLTRFDFGTMLGAWVGALVAEGARADGWNAVLEDEVTFLGKPGHIDVRLWRAEGSGPPSHDGNFDKVRSHVVEIKTKYETSAIKDPIKESGFQLLQAGSYANCDDETKRSQAFTLLVVSPCATKGVRANQFHFDAAPYYALAKADFERMSGATGDEPPVADPPDKWRCFTCQVSTCKKNKNKAAESAELLFA
jgi:hypothetical protein